MAKNYDQLSKDIIRHIGGTGNVNSLFHCMTRLRFKVKDTGRVDKEALAQLTGIIKVMESGGQIQVVIGNHVGDVYDAIFKNTDLKPNADMQEDGTDEKKNVINLFMDTISSIFAPMLMAMTGAGMLKALLMLATTCNVLTTDMGTYRILYAAGDGIFTFLPIILAVTAARKFKTNEFMAMAVAMALVYPDMTAAYQAYQAGEGMTFLKIPVVLASYTSSVIPIIIAVYVMSKLDKVLKKILPQILGQVFTPVLELAVIVPATFLVIGPVFDLLGKALSSGYTGLVGVNPTIAGGVIGLIWPLAVLFGVHWGFIPIVMNNFQVLGYDTLFVITGPNNMAQAGAALGVFLKTKNRELKEMAGPAAISAVLSGVTDPAIYGVTLRFKKPFYIGAVFSGIAGAIVATAGTRITMIVGTSILTLPAYLGVGFAGFLAACAVAYVGAAVVTYLFGYNDDMLPKTEAAAVLDKEEVSEEEMEIKDGTIAAPVDGKVIPLSEMKDEAFSGGLLGQGVAVIPENGRILSPCSGKVITVFPTGHAVCITSDSGAEILIHIGMDTVSLDGRGFRVNVQEGQLVKTGDLLVEADLNIIQSAGLETTTPVVVTNADDFREIRQAATGDVRCGSVICEYFAE